MRRGATLVEGLVAFVVFSMLAVVMMQTYASGRRQGEQVEEHSDLVVAALLLRERLLRDLEVSVSLGVLEDEDVAAGEARGRLVLPGFVRYRADVTPALQFKRITYAWDAGSGRMTRDGMHVLRASTLTQASFRWTEETPRVLEVRLVGKQNVRGKPAELTFRVPAPKGTEVFPAWVFAPHHQGASATN